MKRKTLLSVAAAAIALFSMNTQEVSAGVKKTTQKSTENIFVLDQPDYKTNPYTGMGRNHWMDAAKYLLNGAFSYVNSIYAPMRFPKQLTKADPNNDGPIPT